MTSRFKGRDYSTLRTEIINFLKERFPRDWDSTNLSDPVVVFAESLARVGDQLHYTIDELRRECDIATAKRTSSIYSYAMREGYKMMLPRASFATLSINSSKEQDGMLHLSLKKFDEIVLTPTGDKLYVVDDNIDTDLHSAVDYNYLNTLSDYIDTDGTINKHKRNLYNAYVEDIFSKTQRVNVVLGNKGEFNFKYNDISTDSTVELPNPLIDRTLIRLSYRDESTNGSFKELTYVEDVISSGFNRKSYTLTPKFIGGTITLCLEFPTNYKDIFTDISTTFRFEYIEIQNSTIEPLQEYSSPDAVNFGGAITVISDYENSSEITENGMQYIVDFGNGVKGYSEYENASVTRENYKHFVQDYSSLLTKSDYTNYIKAKSSANCMIFDHGDLYKNPPVLPDNTELLPRVLYITTDSPYSDRESMWYDLVERSSRSDCISLIQFGKDPFSIVVKAECYLIGTSVSTVITQVRNEILKYFSGSFGEKIPKLSMIDYLVHKASNVVIRMESKIVRDTTYGTIDTSLNNVGKLDNNAIDELYSAIGDTEKSLSYMSPIIDSSQESDEYRYTLRKYILVDENLNALSDEDLSDDTKVSNAIKLYYSKFSCLDDNAKEYSDFPKTFPKLYYIHNDTESEIEDYDTLVEHQVTYGECDSPSWDILDTEIFKQPSDMANKFVPKWIQFSYTENASYDTVVRYIKVEDTDYSVSADSADGSFSIPLSGSTASGTGEIKTTVNNPTIYTLDSESSTSYVSNIPLGTSLSSARIYSGYCNSDFVIDPYYIKHHYMMPVLNNVIVLVKSISTK